MLAISWQKDWVKAKIERSIIMKYFFTGLFWHYRPFFNPEANYLKYILQINHKFPMNYEPSTMNYSIPLFINRHR